MKFIDLFAGLGGFHQALADLGHDCVFASEIDPRLRKLYEQNFPRFDGTIAGDIREAVRFKDVPKHDIVCAGFPCQPFSKSGDQEGFADQTRGTLFHEIFEILKRHRPPFVILENVGNFARHDGGRTWEIVRSSIASLGYDVRGTEHICDGGHGLVSPHHLGYPHHRERFFIVATLDDLPANPFPPRDTETQTSVDDIVVRDWKHRDDQREIAELSEQQIRCIAHWNELLQNIPSDVELPSVPIWGDEIEASYPYDDGSLRALSHGELALHIQATEPSSELSKDELLSELPSYATREEGEFPRWKVRYIEENREWFESNFDVIPEDWISQLYEFPPSQRRFEWNCKGEARDLWNCVLQFRPSGLRASRYNTIPSLVSMTTTQIPVLGPEKRFLTRTEGLRLQGLPDEHQLPSSRNEAFSALGNAVHVGVVAEIGKRILGKI